MDTSRIQTDCSEPVVAPWLVLGLCLAVCSPGWARLTVVINEVMASNGKTLADPQGDYDDWIELYNPDRISVNVGGMYLTDNSAVPRKWQIPTGSPAATTIRSRGYLIVWTDGDVAASGLHANFRLDADGDDVYLFGADGVTLLDSLAFDKQTPDVSYGRYPDGGPTLRFFGVPTPGQANNEGYLSEVAPLRFSHERGFYGSAFDLTITIATPGAQILYTLDGYAPHEALPTTVRTSSTAARRGGATELSPGPVEVQSTLYSGPIHISKTTCLRVLAEEPGSKPMPVHTQTCIFDARPELQTLPVVSLVGGPGTVFYEPNGVMAIVGGSYASGVWNASGTDSYNNMLNRDLERPVSLEWIFPDSDEGFGIDCGLRVHGSPYMRPRYVRASGQWSGSGKISLRLYFRGEYGASRLEYPLIPASEVERFAAVVLRAGHNDQTNPFIKDELLRRLHHDMGQAAALGTFANLFINGEYKGFYNVTEHIRQESCQEWFDSDRPWDVMTMSGIRDGDTASFDAMVNYARSHNLADPAYYAEMGRMLDVVSFIDYLIIRLWPNDWDWPQNNWSAACERSATGRWKFFIWDAEGTFRSSDLQTDRFGELGSQGNANGYLYQALQANPDFRRLFGDRLYKHFDNGGALTAENIRRRFSELRENLRSVIPNMDSYIIDGWTPNRQSIFLDACTRVGLYTCAGPSFAVNGVPQYGGQVLAGDRLSIVTPDSRATIYYTLDGTDPSQSGLPLGPTPIPLVAQSSPKRILVPTEPPAGDWRVLDFNDASWQAASGLPGGVGFGRGSGYETSIGTNLAASMYNRNGSCYVRYPFRFEGDPGSLISLVLGVQYDDGFVAYLNGVEVARRNVAGEPVWDSTATTARDNPVAVEFEPIDLTDQIDKLRQGDNILAVQGLNVAANDRDFLLGVELMVAQAPPESANPTGPPVYRTTIPLTRTALVRARSLSGKTWSALAEAVFAVGPVRENLRISEIMYHPAETGRPDDPNAEYIELTNIGDEPIDLDFVRFTRGIRFTFPALSLAPHAFCIVVKDRAAFEARYGPGLPVVGQYEGSLDDGGERIELQDAAGVVSHSFRYRDDWFPATDGLGSSLTIRHPASAPVSSWSIAGTWRPSVIPGGSPGWDDSGTIPGSAAVVINELLANPAQGGRDWIELANTTDGAIDLGGWFLSDDADNLTKYEIPVGTILPPRGFLVLTEDNFGRLGAPGGHESFGFSRAGESAYLSSGFAGHVTGYREHAEFGASEPGVTFGRYVDNAGDAHYVPLRSPTPGAANAAPLVGPVVISEILYHADTPGGVEYIKLLNISDAEVTLYDSVRGQPWRLAGGGGTEAIDLLLPRDPPVTLAPRGGLLLVKDRSLFESRFGIAQAVPVVEWGPGCLDDAGQTIELCRPSDLSNGVRTWVCLDRVTYSDGSHPEDFPAGVDPWPAGADGRGQCLARIDSYGWGDDPGNWRAQSLSPGTGRQRVSR